MNDPMTCEEIARDLKIPVRTVYHYLKNGLGPKAIKVGRHYRVAQGEYQAWKAGLEID